MKRKNIVKALAEKYDKDPRVIDVIVNHPFRYIRDMISDPENMESIRLHYFGVFVQKGKRNKIWYYNKKNKEFIEVLMCYR